MPRITLQLGVEGSADVARSLQGLASAARTAFGTMRSEAATTANAILTGQRRIVSGELAALNARRTIIAQAANAWKASEAAAVAAVVTGSGNRLRLIQAEVAMRRQLMETLKGAATANETAITRMVEGEVHKRTAAAQAGAAAAARAGGGAGGGTGGGNGGPRTGPRNSRAASFAREAVGTAVGIGFQTMDAMHDARYRRAATMETLLQATTQVTGNRAAGQAVMARVTAAAQRHGISADTLAQSVLGAQSEFSALGTREDYRNLTPAQQVERLTAGADRIIGGAVQGRNLGSSPAEFARLQAMFNQQGIRGSANDNLLLSFVAAAQSGAVETGAVTRTAMAPIMGRMQQAATRAAGADGFAAMSPEQQNAARSNAMATEGHQAFVEMQVLAARGYNPRRAGNNMVALNQALTTNVTAERIQNNLRNARAGATGATAASLDALLGDGPNGLFVNDPNRRGHRLIRASAQNGVALSSALSDAGLDPTMMAGILSGGGRGNPQSLQRNWRDVVRSMASQNAEGRTGFEAVKTMQQAHLDAGDVAGMAGTFENSPMATFVRQEEQRLTTLSDNTTALGRVSEALDRFRAEHPSLASAIEHGATLALTAGAGYLAGGAGAGAGAAAGAGGGSGAAGIGTALLGVSMAPILVAAAAGGAILSYTKGLEGDNARAGAADYRSEEFQFGGSDNAEISRYRARMQGRDTRSAASRKNDEMYGGRRATTNGLDATRRGLDRIVGTGEFYSPEATTLGPTLGDVVPSDGYAGGEGESYRGRNGGPAGPANAPSMTRIDANSITALGAAFSQALSTTTVRTEPTAPAAVGAATGGASAAGNAHANPQ